MIRKRALATLAAAALLLSGCAGAEYQDYPLGIGPGPNDLKQSPCACFDLPNPATGNPAARLDKLT